MQITVQDCTVTPGRKLSKVEKKNNSRTRKRESQFINSGAVTKFTYAVTVKMNSYKDSA